jgi:hypothetical protein
MSRLFRVRVLAMFAAVSVACVSGCAAEGELEDTDASVMLPDGGNTPPNVDPNLSPNAATPDGGARTDSGADAGPTVLCDPLAPACPQGLSCVPNTSTGDSTCVASPANTAIGEPCQRSTDCVEGAACVTDSGQTTCRELCDPADLQSCTTAQTFCLQTLGSNPDLGLCGPAPAACSIYDQDCTEGDCILTRNPVDDTIGTFCGTAGSAAVGQACGNGNGSCVAGAVCVTGAGDTQPTCHVVCRTPDLPCASGSCSGTTSSGIDFCDN